MTLRGPSPDRRDDEMSRKHDYQRVEQPTLSRQTYPLDVPQIPCAASQARSRAAPAQASPVLREAVNEVGVQPCLALSAQRALAPVMNASTSATNRAGMVDLM